MSWASPAVAFIKQASTCTHAAFLVAVRLYQNLRVMLLTSRTVAREHRMTMYTPAEPAMGRVFRYDKLDEKCDRDLHTCDSNLEAREMFWCAALLYYGGQYGLG